MQHDGVPNVCFEAGIQARIYLQSSEIAILDSDQVELRRYPLNQKQEALQYALEAACDLLNLDPEGYGVDFL